MRKALNLREPAPFIEDIARETAAFYGLDPAELASRKRNPRADRARTVGMYLARTLTGKTLPEMGRHFGASDQTSVLHACRRVAALYARMSKQDR